MGDVKGYIKVKRQKPHYREVCDRVLDYKDVAILRTDVQSKDQASRCMDCGIPFCHWACPIGNYIPEWNDAVFHGHWEEALKLLHASNNFPEITGRICPALCEYSCVLAINDDAVTIRENELAIIEQAFKKGFIKPNPPKKRTGKKVAVIGSGPAGLACADQLNKAGHNVVVYEKDAKVGGILRYGIPDFKLEKQIINRRIKLLEAEGIKFITGANVGVDINPSKIRKDYNAICLTGGSRVPRDMKIEGRDLAGIHFAMDYLTQSNKNVSGEAELTISVKGKKVVVIGGGDTGADCVGTANRQGAKSVVQIEVLPKPSECRSSDCPWPKYPTLLKTTSSHEEGAERHWSVVTKSFVGENGKVQKLTCEKEGKPFEINADIVIIAIGFLHPQKEGLLKDLGVELDDRGNVRTGDNYMTSVKSVFSAGDMRRGQSLVVWAISEGRRCAYFTDKYLMGKSNLPVI
jgi:glutamate synthase (NADPH/NADH) small chain